MAEEDETEIVKGGMSGMIGIIILISGVIVGLVVIQKTSQTRYVADDCRNY